MLDLVRICVLSSRTLLCRAFSQALYVIYARVPSFRSPDDLVSHSEGLQPRPMLPS
jgi:hypothetical protein